MVEANRKSLWHVLENNLQIASRNIYIHRLFYFGEHFYLNDEEEMISIFRKSINTVNESYCDEHLTGLLLYYSKYYVHILEGSEDGITRHLVYLFNSNRTDLHFGKVKTILTMYNINQRFFETWLCKTAVPPTMLTVLDPNCEKDEHFRHIKNTIFKLYNLSLLIRSDPKSVKKRSVTEKAFPYLPEAELLTFLLCSPFTFNLDTYFQIYATDRPTYTLYNEKVWPIEHDFIPYDVFDEKIDPIPDLK